MPSYPIDPDKLLAAAELLVPATPGRGRPSYTAHRRGVSTAYYAVYHAIGDRVAEQVFPTAGTKFRDRIRRWITHTDIKTVATWIGQLDGSRGGSPPKHIAGLFSAGPSPAIDRETSMIADGFLELHEKREEADYDHSAVFTRPDTLGHLALARQVVETVEGAESGEAQMFFGLIAMQAKVQAR